MCKKKFDKPKDPFWKRVARYVYVHLHKRRWFYGYAFFEWLKVSADLIQCSGDKLPLVTIVVSSLAHLVDANMRYKRIIGLINHDTTALSILQLELSVYFNRSLFWASNDNSDLAKCVEAFGFFLAWPTTALTLFGGWSLNLNGDIWGWIRAIKGFAEESKFAGVSKKNRLIHRARQSLGLVSSLLVRERRGFSEEKERATLHPIHLFSKEKERERKKESRSRVHVRALQ